jgi:hypothetical protein
MPERLKQPPSQEVLMSIVYLLIGGMFFVICRTFVEFCEKLREDGQ